MSFLLPHEVTSLDPVPLQDLGQGQQPHHRDEVPEWQRIEGSEQEKVPMGAVMCHIFLLTISIHKLVFAAK